MFGLITGAIKFAGAGMSAYQAIQEERRIKEATAKSNAALQSYKNIQEQNALASLQAPDISSLKFDRDQRNIYEGVNALSQTTENAIGGVANLVQAGQEANLQTAMQQGDVNFQRDAMKAQEQARIGQDAARRQEEVAGYQLGEANNQFNTAMENKNAAISGILGGIGGGIGAVAGDFDPATGRYKYKKDKAVYNYGGSVFGEAPQSADYLLPSVSANYGVPVEFP